MAASHGKRPIWRAVAGARLLIGLGPETDEDAQATWRIIRARSMGAACKTLRAHHAGLSKSACRSSRSTRSDRERRALFPFAPSEIWFESVLRRRASAGAGQGRATSASSAASVHQRVAKALPHRAEGLENVRLRAGDAGALIASLPTAPVAHLHPLSRPWPSAARTSVGSFRKAWFANSPGWRDRR